jgi:hypothetical protein
MFEHCDRSVAAVGDEIGQNGCAILVSAFLTVVSRSAAYVVDPVAWYQSCSHETFPCGNCLQLPSVPSW